MEDGGFLWFLRPEERSPGTGRVGHEGDRLTGWSRSETSSEGTGVGVWWGLGHSHLRTTVGSGGGESSYQVMRCV